MNESQSQLAYAKRQLRYWQSRVNFLSAVASDAQASDAKEKEAEKRDIPPTPPIERKGEEKERSYISACARARDCDAGLSKDELQLLFTSPLPEHRELLRNYTAPCPTLARAVAHARLRGFNDETFVTKWYDCMEMSCWMDNHGNPIQNWCSLLMKWIINRKYFDKFQDPSRIPDAMFGGGRSASKPINWRGMIKEDLDGFLG